MKKLFLIAIIVPLAFSSCKKDVPAPVDTTLTDAMARDSLYYLMQQWYYWYNVMPSVTKENYSDPYKLMDAMRYKPLDKWSFVADYNQFIAEMQGTFVGHGFRIGSVDSADARIAMIYPESPLYGQGVRRGWQVEKINDVPIAPILKSGTAEDYNNVIGPATAGVTNKFLFRRPDGTEVTISSTKSTFTVSSVLVYDTLHLTSGITGHLVFDSFIEPSEQELSTAFAYFKANGVKDLILDLRYNSGGYLYIAQELASYIAGNAAANSNSVFALLSYNSKEQSQNTSFKFVSTTAPLSLSRLVVVSTRFTASASEAVMNGLKPLMDVVSIGDTTSGKPVGMNGWSVGNKYFFWPITFKIVNANNEGDYFDGIVPAKEVEDDITHDFSDRHELCLNEAIHYLETGSVSAKSLRGVPSFYRHSQYSEKPSWMNNGFTIVK